MGYTTEFEGHVTISPPLSAEEVGYINKFSESRRMHRKKGPYYLGTGPYGQDREADVINYNSPDPTQPGLWCQWAASESGETVQWNGTEKFYEADRWMEYLIEHFIGPKPKAAEKLPFFTGHTVSGSILAQGEEISDRWTLKVLDSKVSVVKMGAPTYEDKELLSKLEEVLEDMERSREGLVIMAAINRLKELLGEAA